MTHESNRTFSHTFSLTDDTAKKLEELLIAHLKQPSVVGKRISRSSLVAKAINLLYREYHAKN